MECGHMDMDIKYCNIFTSEAVVRKRPEEGLIAALGENCLSCIIHLKGVSSEM
jgi:hypothetical protein